MFPNGIKYMNTSLLQNMVNCSHKLCRNYFYMEGIILINKT